MYMYTHMYTHIPGSVTDTFLVVLSHQSALFMSQLPHLK